MLLVGPPLDHFCTKDLNATFSDIGKVLLWERDPNRKGRIMAKLRVTKLDEIPKSVRMTIGDYHEFESWTFSVEVMLQNLLGGGPADEDPIPDHGVDPHPLPGNLNAAFVPSPPPPPLVFATKYGWGHWAMGNNPPSNQPEFLDNPNEVVDHLAMNNEHEDMLVDPANQPPHEDISDVTIPTPAISASSDNASYQNSRTQHGSDNPPEDAGQSQELRPMGEGLLKILHAYSSNESKDELGDDNHDDVMMNDVGLASPNVAHI